MYHQRLNMVGGQFDQQSISQHVFFFKFSESPRSCSVLTSIIHNSPSCPVLDDHGQLSNSGICLHIRSNHACIFEGKRVVYVHVAGQAKFRIPDLDNWYLGCRNTNNFFHSACEVGGISIYGAMCPESCSGTEQPTPRQEIGNHAHAF